jgi:hypothetical protein
MCSECADVTPVGTATARALFGKPEFREREAPGFKTPIASVVVHNTLTALSPDNRENDGLRKIAGNTVPMIKEFLDNNKNFTL